MFGANHLEGGAMGDKIDELEKDINNLKLQLEKERISRSGDRKIVIVIAAALAVFFGYNTFWQVPREITKALNTTAAKTASDRIGQLKNEAENELLPKINKIESDADAAKKNAEQSAESAKAYAKEAAKKWKLQANSDLRNLHSAVDYLKHQITDLNESVKALDNHTHTISIVGKRNSTGYIKHARNIPNGCVITGAYTDSGGLILYSKHLKIDKPKLP